MSQGDLTPFLPRVLATAAPARPAVVAVDGTLLFADLSGFTALSERLARQGRVGAELMTDVLNDRFGRLLDEVAAYGGDLLCFGGDAVLVLFDGVGHGERALTCAVRMRSALRGTRPGLPRVRLQMSVGVASGEVLLAVVGRAHPVLVPFGATVSTTLALEAAASSSQILTRVADETWSALGALGADRVTTDDDPSAAARLVARLRRPASPLSAPLPAPLPSTTAALIDRHLEARVADGARAEHRVAAVGFVKFTGTDALATDPAEAARILHDLVGLAQEAADRHDVTFLAEDVDKDGGKLILTAGGLHATGDDETALILACQEILEGGSPLGLRAGVHRGLVFAGPVGNERRRAFTVIGDAVNLAARVMAAAPPASLLATPEILDHARTSFEATPVPAFMAKGKSAPVRAAVVGDAIGQRQRLVSGSLVGRDAEVAAVAAALAAPAAVVVVVAEAGAGKSALAAAAGAELEPLRRVLVECGRYLASSPYGALREPLRALVGLPPDDEEAAARLGQLVAEHCPGRLVHLPLVGLAFGLDLPDTAETASIAPEFRRTLVGPAVADLVAVTAGEPTVLVVEDAHWLDDASCAVLEAVARGVPEWRFLITRRPGEELASLGLAPTLQVELARLSDDAAARLVRQAAAGTPLLPDVVAGIVERGAGHPLFLTQLTEAVVRGLDPADLPTELEPLLVAVLDRVGGADRDLTATAAVVGQRVDLGHLGWLADLGPVQLIERLRNLDDIFAVDGGQARFRHALLRDAAYESMPFRRRRTLHRMLADRLGDDALAPVELRAIHEVRAQRWDRAFPVCVAAALTARRAGAPMAAIGFLEDALTARRHLGPATGERGAALAEDLAELYRVVGRPADAVGAAARGRRLTNSPERRASLRLARNRAITDEGGLRKARRSYRHLAGDEQLPVATRRLALADLATVLRQEGRSRTAVALVEEALARLGDDDGVLSAQLAFALGEVGDPRAIEATEAAMVATSDRRRRGLLHCNLGVEQYYASSWDAAAASFQRALTEFVAVGDATETGRVVNNLAEIDFDQGHLDRAAEGLALAHDHLAAANNTYGLILVSTNLARLAAARGDAEGAARWVADARRRREAAGTAFNAAENEAAACEGRLAAGDPAGAIDLASDALEQVDEWDTPPSVRARLARLRAIARARLGDTDGAAGDLGHAVEAASAGGSVFEAALASRARSVLLGAERDALEDCFDDLGVRHAARGPFLLGDRTER